MKILIAVPSFDVKVNVDCVKSIYDLEKPEGSTVDLEFITGYDCAKARNEIAKRALEGGLINVSALLDGQLVGMGRMVGDGAMYWYLQEIIILPEYQKIGIGTKIVNYLIDYAVEHSATGTFTTIGGVSAKGKEGFYSKLGFDIIPNGIKKIIEICCL